MTAYRVEKGAMQREGENRNRMWEVMGPDGYLQGISYQEREAAEEHAKIANWAFDEGRKFERQRRKGRKR